MSSGPLDPGGTHWNQPGGELLPSPHPNIAGRERELRALADAVRRLVDITVVNSASAERTAAAARELERIAEGLEDTVPETPPQRYAGVGADHPHDFFQYDPVLGLYNPIALPVEMSWQAPVAVGRAVFGTPYEGPPGCVHGAVLAAVFDQVFNVANIKSGTAGPTVDLTMRYRKPTPLHRELRFEAQVERTTDRRIHTTGRVLHDGVVTVESEGTFARIDPERIARGLVDEAGKAANPDREDA